MSGPARSTPGAATAPGDPAAIARSVLRWGAGRRDHLPWRATRDPYAVLVSEVMAQQTGIDRVVPYWERFTARFPTPAALAAAPLGDVLTEWSGLGYPRRARALWEAAAVIGERHGGSVPDSYDDLVALPGVGPYTARAVLAFAYGQRHAVVDTNVVRVVARAVAGRRVSAPEAQSAADALLGRRDPWRHNQSMLDFGALVCTARRPGCDGCPVRTRCAWAAAGWPEPDPAAIPPGRRQARFEGSDRQARGRVLARLSDGPLELGAIGPVAGVEDADRARLILDSLVGDGLAVVSGRGAGRVAHLP